MPIAIPSSRFAMFQPECGVSTPFESLAVVVTEVTSCDLLGYFSTEKLVTEIEEVYLTATNLHAGQARLKQHPASVTLHGSLGAMSSRAIPCGSQRIRVTRCS